MQVVLISGLSGAGKSHAANILEDMGYYCVDNMPVELISKFVEFCLAAGGKYEKVALVTDIRVGDSLDKLSSALDGIRSTGCEIKVIFLEASTDTIIRRYKETRRPHPLMREGEVIDAVIRREREKLEPVKAGSDIVIDTTGKSGNVVRGELGAFLGSSARYSPMAISVLSFGFKYGLPSEADLVFDVRFLPNPFYVDNLRDKTGLDDEVRDYVFSYEATKDFIGYLIPFLEYLIPHYIEEGKSTLTIGIGCTGGRHRSTSIAAHIADCLRDKGYSPVLTHRDISKDS